jgi:hypothetical protein
MKQFPKVSNEFNSNYYQYSQQPIDKTISFRLPSALAEAFNSAVKKMGAKSSDELRNFMIDYISYVQSEMENAVKAQSDVTKKPIEVVAIEEKAQEPPQ